MTRLSQHIRRAPLQLGVHVFVAGLLTAACAGSAASVTTATATTAQPIKPQEAPTTTTKPGASGDPTAVLAGLRVEPEGPRAGYKRELFVHWVDADRDGCDAREEVLIAESRSPAQVDPYGCKVVEGDWHSAYDGLTFTDPSELDIDHMVALAEAWDSGAAGWDAGRRQAFANDLDHPQALRAVSASSNRSKGDLDPGQWKPTRDAAWCEYANDWVTVKKAWDLSADQNEVDDLRVMLRTCGEQSPSAASPAPAVPPLRSSGFGTTLDGVLIALPLFLLLLVWGVTSGAGSNFVVLLPILVMLGAGAVVVTIAMRDDRPRSNPNVRQLPTDHLRRQMFLALRPNRSRRQQGRDKPAE